MISPTLLTIWSALCVGIVFSDQAEAGCLGTSWTCTTQTTCPNPQKEVRDGNQILRRCVTNQGEEGVCCITNAVAGRKSDEHCNEYGKSVYTTEFNPETNTNERVVNCVLVRRIINGQEVIPAQFPHMALIGRLLYEERDWHCGGSLVSDLYVLSAAHCTEGTDEFDYGWKATWARLGAHNLDSEEDERYSKDYEIVEWFVHPGYADGYSNDIALYKLNQSVAFSLYVRPICLNSKPDVTETHAIVTGWGYINYETEKRSKVLRKARLMITNCTQIDQDIVIKESQKPSVICAADLHNERDTCNGDSGGPIQIRLQNPFCMYSVLGVTSSGPRPCAKTYHSCYTRVSYYLAWIESIVWP